VKESLRYTDVSLPVRDRARVRHGRTGWSEFVSDRAAVVSFGVAELVALVLRLHWARGAWFGVDDWDFVASRTVGNVGDLFRAHLDHWATMIVLAYRLLFSLFGLRYLPYAVFAIVLHLVVGVLLRVLMRRAGVGPWTATAAATVFVFLGTGIENNFFTSAMVFGLLQLLFADHDGPVDRRDFLGLGAGAIGLMCSALAVTMTIVVGIATLSRRGWRAAMFHTVPLAALYLLWLFAAPASPSNGTDTQSISNVLTFLNNGQWATLVRVGRLPGFGVVVAAVLVAGLIVIYAAEGVTMLRHYAAPLAMLVGGPLFLVSTGVKRSGLPAALHDAVFRSLNNPAHLARQDRYTYVVAALTLPTLAVAVSALGRRWQYLRVVIAVLMIATLPTVVRDFRRDALAFARTGPATEGKVLAVPRLPIARELPRTLIIPAPIATGPSVGWLLDTLPSGRLPAPPHLTQNNAAALTLSLALVPAALKQGATGSASCENLRTPTVRILDKADRLTLRRGGAIITYLGPTGGRSLPTRFQPGTYVALAGPLRLRVAPSASHLAAQTVLCG